VSAARVATGDSASPGTEADAGSPLPTGDPLRITAARTGLQPELAPLVQQQLSSLANNIYSFHGLIWAGQPFQWEIIDEDSERSRQLPGEPDRPWKTRLKLLLPSLGDIDATIQLTGTDVSIEMTAGSENTPNALLAGGDRLRTRMELAGLRLLALDVRSGAVNQSGGARNEASE
jgi:hypothetical protein